MCVLVYLAGGDGAKFKEVMTRKRASKQLIDAKLVKTNKRSSYQKLRITLSHDDINIDLQKIKTAINGHNNRASRSKS